MLIVEDPTVTVKCGTKISIMLKWWVVFRIHLHPYQFLLIKK
jgi:hypothetical protein